MLEDVQNRRDHRRLPIDEVGITGIRYPVAVPDREHGKQNTIADVTMSVDLSPELKGTHLSRFVEILHDAAAEVTPTTLPVMLGILRDRLAARRAHLEFRFPYFLRRAAPVTGVPALMDYQCWLSGELDDTGVAAHARRPGSGNQRVPVQQGHQRLRCSQPARLYHYPCMPGVRGGRPASSGLG